MRSNRSESVYSREKGEGIFVWALLVICIYSVTRIYYCYILSNVLLDCFKLMPSLLRKLIKIHTMFVRLFSSVR